VDRSTPNSQPNGERSSGKTRQDRGAPIGESYRERRDRKVCAWKTAGVVAECSCINIGDREIFAAVPPGRDAHPVRVFATFTEDLQKLADWLVTCGIATVAMESTGVYWIPLFDILEARAIKPV
jgi:hypothetical protein